MSQVIELKAESRDPKASLITLRKSGKIPAVFYGKKEASTPISIKEADFKKVWKQAGESTVVTLERPEGSIDSLIKDISFDPVTGSILHADFYVFEKGKVLEIKVPVVFEGESPAVKSLGALLVKVLHEIEVSAEPKNLPHEIVANIESLAQFGDQILAKDLKLPTGVNLVQNPDDVVALVDEPKEEVEEVVAPSLEDIEISEERGKKEEEGEAPAEEPKKEAKKE